MTKRIIAIVFIFICASAAWAILGGTIFARTQGSDSTLRGRVASTLFASCLSLVATTAALVALACGVNAGYGAARR